MEALEFSRVFKDFPNVVSSVFGSSLIAYWKLGEASGTVAEDSGAGNLDGTYTAVTLAQTGIGGSGGTSALFNGSTSKCVLPAGVGTAFDPTKGTLLAYIKVPSAAYVDGQTRHFFRIFVNANNQLYAQKFNGVNTIYLSYTANGINKNSVVVTDADGWICVGLTWSIAADELITYIGGEQHGYTLTGLGTWAGVPALLMIGAGSSTPVTVWSGNLAHIALGNEVLSAEKMRALSRYSRPKMIPALQFGDSKTTGGRMVPLSENTRTFVRLNDIALGGTDTAYWAANIDAALAAYIGTPKIILYNLGVNDRLAMPTEATWNANCGYILSAFHAKWPDAKIYMMRVWARGSANTPIINGWINAMIAARATYVFAGPDESIWLENGDDGVTYSTDGVHYNAAGYNVVRAQWRLTIP